MLNNFIYSETKGLFLEQLDQKNIPEEAIAFLEDSGEIGNRNHYFGSVGVNNLLTEGKLIGTITANNNPYNIYAPKTYNWSEITSKPTTLAGYGITDGIKYVNGIDLANGVPHNEAGYGYNQYGWKANGPALSIGTDGYLMLLQVSTSDGQLYRRYIGGDYKGAWYKILDDNNYASVLDTRYLQLTGGELSGGLTIKNNSGLYFKDTLGKAILALYVNSANKLILGAGANAEGYSTYIEGKNVYVNNNIALHGGNYSDLITTLNGNLSVKGRLLVGGATDDGNSALAVKGHARTTALTISSALYINRDWLTGKMNDANNSGLSINTTAEAVSFSVWNKAGVLASDSLLKLDTSRKATIEGDLYVTGNIIADGQVSSGGIEIDPATISTQISQLTATIEGLQSTVKLLQDELNSLK